MMLLAEKGFCFISIDVSYIKVTPTKSPSQAYY